MSDVGDLTASRSIGELRQGDPSRIAGCDRLFHWQSENKRPALPDDLSREVYCVLGIPIDVVDMSEALRRIETASSSSAPYLVSTPNLNFLISSREDAEFRESVLQSDLCPPDGMPIVWIARMMGLPIRHRVAGSDIFDGLKSRNTPRPLKTFLFGGAAGIAAAVRNVLNAKPLGLCCVGSLYPGYGTVDGMSSDEILDTINASRAEFLAVALSAAKGQAWLYQNHLRLTVPVRVQLGASINFQAGTIKRAPAILQKLGLEWLWRIKEEPHLWRRYAFDGLALLKLLFTSVVPIAALARCQQLWVGTSSRSLAVESSRSDTAVIVKFSGSAVVQNAEQAAAKLREALAANRDLVIDLSETRVIDARFLGLLMMARKVARSRGICLIVTRVSQNIERLFRLNGAAYLLSAGRG